MDQTFVCCSTYHVYISILEAYKYKHQGHDSILIFYDDLIENIEEFLVNVERIGVFKKVLRIKGYTIIRGMKKRFGYYTYIFKRKKALVDLFQSYNPSLVEWDDYMKNSQFNLFQINRTRIYFLIQYSNNYFRMYEDGYGTYTQKLKPIRKFNRKYITRTPMLKGHDPQVKEVFVSYPEKVTDKVLIPKLKKLDLEALEKHLTADEKEKVVWSMVGGITLSKEAASLIITQPLSEDHFCTEEIKKTLYQRLVDDELKFGKIVYVKTHPREKTTYDFESDKVFLLPKYFPLEIFNLSANLKIERGISFFSTALYNLRHVEEKVLLGEDFLKDEIRKITA